MKNNLLERIRSLIFSFIAVTFLLLSVGQTTKAASKETPVQGILTVRYYGRGGVNLLDTNGKYQMQYVKANSRWKVFAKAIINGRVMYRIGNQRQWIPAQYSRIGLSNVRKSAGTKTDRRRQQIVYSQVGPIIGDRRTKVYHLPGQRRYRISQKNIVHFKIEQDAKNAGFVKSKR